MPMSLAWKLENPGTVRSLVLGVTGRANFFSQSGCLWKSLDMDGNE